MAIGTHIMLWLVDDDSKERGQLVFNTTDELRDKYPEAVPVDGWPIRDTEAEEEQAEQECDEWIMHYRWARPWSA